MTSVRKWFRVLAAVTACVALVYPVFEALDSTAITDTQTEFEFMAFLLVLGLLVALLHLILLAVKMLIWGSVQAAGQRVSVQRRHRVLSMVRPPGLDPPLSLRI
jgi:hypothetical protein